MSLYVGCCRIRVEVVSSLRQMSLKVLGHTESLDLLSSEDEGRAAQAAGRVLARRGLASS